jgi:CTP:molybdopterin cytidylyltransferase MocA
VRVGAVVLAAGEGRRFRQAGGGIKQLALVDGRPLIEGALRAMEAAPFEDHVLVLGNAADDVAAGIEPGAFRPVVHEGWAQGMASSLRAGLAALDDCGAAVVVLGDALGLDGQAVVRVADAVRSALGSFVAAQYDRRWSHPVGLTRSRWLELPSVGEEGARALGAPDYTVDCRDLSEPGDLDRPA